MGEISKELLKRAMIPEKYWDAKLKNIPDEHEYKGTVKTYMQKIMEAVARGYGLYLYSKENSTGKTALACIVGKYALEQELTVLYMPSEQIVDSIIQGWVFDENETYRHRMTHVDILIVDDLNQGYKSSGKMLENKVESIVRERVQHNKTVIITSNLEPGNVKEEFSNDFAELCKESMALVKVSGINWRDQKKQEIREFLKG